MFAFGRHAWSIAVERLDPRVVAVIRAATDERSPYAEIWRRVRPQLERRGLACPSYDAVRKLVRTERAERAARGGETLEFGWGGRIQPWSGRVSID